MRPYSSSADWGGPWVPYVPDSEAPWDLRRVVHLHRRAGFAATWDELQRDLKDGPEPSITRLLQGKSRMCGVPANFAAWADRLAELALAVPEPNRLKGWWVYRMLFGPDPLTERLTLMWHDHFATSNLKVADLALMLRQNEVLRAHCRAPFGRLLHAMLRDPALLVWLDAELNSKGHPNENLARELMELFTLGIGHYSEDDVKEAARALTGWVLGVDQARFVPVRHDAGTKTVLGQSGAFGADSLAALLLDHPATSRRLAWRLCREFFGEASIDGRALAALADGLRSYDLDIGWGVSAVLRSGQFFDAANVGRRVASPIEYTLGAVRALEILDPRRPRRCWPTGAAGWARTCFTRPMSVAGPAGEAGSRPARSSAAPISPPPWSASTRSAWVCHSTRSRWPSVITSGEIHCSSRSSCSAPTVPRFRSMPWARLGKLWSDYCLRPRRSAFDPCSRSERS